VPPKGEPMRMEDNHLSDEDLVLAADGELSARAAARVESHLAACWTCRARKHEIEGAVGEFVRIHLGAFEGRIPSPDGPRALLKAQMHQLNAPEPGSWLSWFRGFSLRTSAAIMIAAGAVVAIGYLLSAPWVGLPGVRASTVMMPDPRLTPGATVFISREQVCRASNTRNVDVPQSVQRKVFAEYGIPGAAPHDFEVDYLITPALGGADDIHNLWPESYGAIVWNARVKDALEDRLRDLVCSGQLDLETAQREIAVNWIGAYKKYFHTERPLTTDARLR
jgi:Putative zinc-finger